MLVISTSLSSYWGTGGGSEVDLWTGECLIDRCSLARVKSDLSGL